MHEASRFGAGRSGWGPGRLGLSGGVGPAPPTVSPASCNAVVAAPAAAAPAVSAPLGDPAIALLEVRIKGSVHFCTFGAKLVSRFGRPVPTPKTFSDRRIRWTKISSENVLNGDKFLGITSIRKKRRSKKTKGIEVNGIIEACRAIGNDRVRAGGHPVSKFDVFRRFQRRVTDGALRSLFRGRRRNAGTPVRGAASGTRTFWMLASHPPASPANGKHRRCRTPTAGASPAEREEGRAQVLSNRENP